jgi:tRNA nucleotidyltransferase (CCA-adding enzyme)
MHSNIALTKDQEEDGITKHTGVRSCLNKHYHSVTSGYANSMLIGSWGKLTRVRPVRDIDVLFVLPYSVYQRLQQAMTESHSH